jgi:hypothetical protein
MKVLLLGEFSGLHNNLKDGLLSLGCDVTLASTGDSWKKFDSDISWKREGQGVLDRVKQVKKVIKSLPDLKGYDVVQLIAPSIISPRFYIDDFLFDFVRKNNGRVFLVGAGCVDAITADYLQREFYKKEYYEEILKFNNGVVWCQTGDGRRFTDKVLSKIDGFIPIMYEYAEGLRRKGYDKLCGTIPMPINIDNLVFSKNEIQNGRVFFFHGLNREGVKGTPLIREALAIVKNEYPEEIEYLLQGHMPIDEYLTVLQKSNVVIDQAHSVSCGMNGLYSMAQGKIVIGGGNKEYLDEFGLERCPLVPIENNVEDIVFKIKNLLLRKSEFDLLSRESRKYVEETHDCKIIAKRFIDTWMSN